MNVDAYEIDTGQEMEDCSFCMAVHKSYETATFRTMHCFLCNRCASKEIDVEIHNPNLAALLENGFGCVTENDEELAELGTFKWICQGCEAKLANSKNLASGCYEDVMSL